MKRIWTVTFAGLLFLTACNGGGEEESTEEETMEESSEEETVEEESAGTTDEESEESSEEGSGNATTVEAEEDSVEESDEAESASSDDRTEDLTEGEIDEVNPDDAYDIDEDKVRMVENAAETGKSMEDVLKAPSEITSYIQDTSIIIEVTEGEQIVNQSFQGITAEIDEADGNLEVASDYFDENFQIIQPHGYGNSGTGELFMYTGAGWEDYSAQYEAEELIYGTYSNLHKIIGQMPDSLQVLEEGDYDILYYTGNDDIVHQLYQDNFKVEFTGANMDELEMGLVAFINKESGDLESANLIATAPGLQNPEQTLTIEIILNYQEYGLFDEGTEIKKPNPDDIAAPSTEDEGIEGSVE